MSEFEGERIAKVIARAGVCSRREAEQLILDGHVTLNHKILKTAAINVTDADQIRINGKPLPQKEESKLWRYHKPDGLVVSHKDPQGRPSVFDKLQQQLPRVVSIGRLDINTEGLLLLTNDGGLARILDWILKSIPGIPASLHFFVFQPRALVVHLVLFALTAVAAAAYPVRLVATLPIAATLRREVVS